MIKAFIIANPYEVFSLLTVVGAIYHWIQKATKGEASFNPVEYWLKDTPGYTYGTIGALAVAWWGVVGFDMLEGMKWQMVVMCAIGTGYTLNSATSKGAVTAATGAVNKATGFVRLFLLPWLMLMALCAMLAGCPAPGPRPNAPSSVPEGIEASALLIGKISDRLVVLSCTQFRDGACIEAGKPLMPRDSLKIHERLEEMHNALAAAASFGAGQVGECLGARRTQTACLAAVNAVVIELDNYLIEAGSKH